MLIDGAARRSGGGLPASRRLRFREAALAVAVVVAALAVRVPFLSHESIDYRFAVSVWYDFIVANGYFDSWRYDFAHYSPPYLYLLTAAAWLFPSAPVLWVVKTISIAGDFVLALFAYGCVRLRFRESRFLPILAAGAVLLAPTVVLNSARWGQADALYTALLMACLYALLAGRGKWACAAFGLAFAVKAQAVFLAPLLYWLRARKSLPGGAVALIPAVFVLTLVPAALAGRPALDLLTVYGGQVGFYSELTKEAPNLYQWISNDHYRWWPLGVLLTAALVHGVRRFLDRRRPEMTRETVVFLALFSVLLTPFFLPKMLDRFFFPADVFAIVLAFYRPRLWFVPVAVGTASLTAYAYSSFFYTDAPLGWAAALLLVVLADLTRRLLVGLGWRPDFRAAPGHFWRRARAGWKAAAPALALLLALAALFAGFAGDGRLGRPLANDGESARTLARAGARFADSGLFAVPSEAPVPLGDRPGSGRSTDRPATSGEGREPRGIVPGGSALGDFALGAGLRHFGDDLSAQVAAARALMLLLYGGAALLAYLSLRRILSFRWPARRDSNRWIALAATLFAFGSAAAAGAETVAVAGAPAAFGVFLFFHGMVVFLGEGRFAPLLAKGGVALLLGWSAYALLASFVVVGLLGEWRRRRLAAARAGGGGTAPVFGPLPEGSLRGPIGSPFLALGLFGLVVGLAAASSGAVGGTASSVRSAERFGDRESAAVGETLRPGFRRIARGFVPYAASGGVFSVAGIGEGMAERGGAAAASALLVAAGLAFAAFARSLPLLALGLGGLVSALWFGGGGSPETGSMSALGISLVGFTALGQALRRAFGTRRSRAGVGVAAGAAVGVWAVSFLPPDVGAGRGEASAAERAATDRLREDFGRIRRTLSRRTERTVFLAPLRVGEGTVAGARAEFLLGDAVPITDPARRSSAEFVVNGESGGGRAEALLTPGNEVAFLHHRAAYDGALDDWIAEAGAPRVRSEFRIHLGGGRLLFVKEGCAAENTEGTFLVHLVPEDPDDLPPRRKAYGFENRSFRFPERALERGERCVAGVRFPEYPIRSVIVGRSFRNPDATYETIWREEFAPNGAGAAVPEPEAPPAPVPGPG